MDKMSVFNREANAPNPEVRYMPAILQFLGYNPLPGANGWAEQLARHRTTLGLSRKAVTKRLGVDANTPSAPLPEVHKFSGAAEKVQIQIRLDTLPGLNG